MAMLPALGAMIVMGSDSFSSRAKDWRNGAVVYQVFVDRFAPSDRLDSKRGLYRAPQSLKPWDELPKARYDAATKSYPHVYDFWGGDLPSLQKNLGYVEKLGADVLYLQPIFTSPSNHKYDTTDYLQIDPQYGTAAEFQGLVADVHRRKMRIMLDGVFNHIGDTSTVFRDPKHRSWFYFDAKDPKKYQGWAGASTLPRLRLESPEVRGYLWNNKDSVVRHYLRQGVDGWRLDVAFELGPDYLTELTSAAHQTLPGSAVVGEISGYPSEWGGAVDGTFNFTPYAIGQALVGGKVTGGNAGRMLGQMVADAGIDHLLKSWILTDNHDTPRLATEVPKLEDRNLIRVMQLTLPGSPCLYYGSELGMTGGGDPACRAPMRWDLVEKPNPDLDFTSRLLAIRRQHPALRYGDFRELTTSKLLAYVRTTDQVRESVLVAINPTAEPVTESTTVRIGRLMSWGILTDVLTKKQTRAIQGVVTLTVPPKSAVIMVPEEMNDNGYSPYERIHNAEKAKKA